MNARALLYEMQMIAYNCSCNDLKQFPASKETLVLIDSLRNMSVDPSVNKVTQVSLLLLDIKNFLETLDADSKSLANTALDPQKTSIKAGMPEIDMSPEARKSNQDFRNKFLSQIYGAMKEFSIKNNLAALPNGSDEYLHKTDEFMQMILEKFANDNKDALNYYKNKDLTKFSIEKNLTASEAGGRFAHATLVVEKEPDPGENFREKHFFRWYAKYCIDRTIAAREVVAQEFFRLFLPSQPKTRLAKNVDLQSFVLSQGATGSKNLAAIHPKVLRKNLESGAYKGMGCILVFDMLLNEVDAKFTNMFVTESVNANGELTGQINKIDGDWCFARLRDNQFKDNMAITARDLDTLPVVTDYKPYNWLDLLAQDKINNNYLQHPESLASSVLKDNQEFRREINETLLSVLTMPQALIQKFVEGYIEDPVEINLLTDEIRTRVEQLRQAAMNNVLFQKYIQSNAAKILLENSVRRMSEFTFRSKGIENKLIKEPLTDITARVFKEFDRLCEDTQKVTAAKVKPKVVAPIMTPLFKAGRSKKAVIPVTGKILSTAPTHKKRGGHY